MPNTMFRMRYAIMLTALCVGTANLSVAEEELPTELRRCSLIDATSARLACYDALSGRELAGSSTSPGSPKSSSDLESPAAPPRVDTAPQSQPEKSLDNIAAETQPQTEKSLDDIDAETRPGAYGKQVEELIVRGTVTRCGKDAHRKYLFYFDNGQVWKQVGSKRLYFKDCSFGVTITQDIFGYKMQPDGGKSRIRILRIK